MVKVQEWSVSKEEQPVASKISWVPTLLLWQVNTHPDFQEGSHWPAGAN